jgi:hypothetical protein
MKSIFQEMLDALKGISKFLPQPGIGGERLITNYDPEVKAVFDAIDLASNYNPNVLPANWCIGNLMPLKYSKEKLPEQLDIGKRAQVKAGHSWVGWQGTIKDHYICGDHCAGSFGKAKYRIKQDHGEQFSIEVSDCELVDYKGKGCADDGMCEKCKLIIEDNCFCSGGYCPDCGSYVEPFSVPKDLSGTYRRLVLGCSGRKPYFLNSVYDNGKWMRNTNL